MQYKNVKYELKYEHYEFSFYFGYITMSLFN